MKTRKTRSPGTRGPVRQAGFTLVELLVVISVILLLAMLLIPTVDRIMLQVYAAKSATMVKGLHDGILVYKEKNRLLPGEQTKDDEGVALSPTPRARMDSGTLTGSQVLAACLFDIEFNRIGTKDFSQQLAASDPDTIDASKVYAEFKPEYLMTYKDSLTNKTVINSISDGFPKGKAMPICYFLASNKLQDNNEPRQFQLKHDNPYLDTHDCESPNDPVRQQDLEIWLTSRGSANQVLNNGEFVLIAAGIDRDYLVDTLENPQDEKRPLHEADKDDIANDYGGSN